MRDLTAIEAESAWDDRDVARTMHDFLGRAKAAHGNRPAISFQLLSGPEDQARDADLERSCTPR